MGALMRTAQSVGKRTAPLANAQDHRKPGVVNAGPYADASQATREMMALILDGQVAVP
jgi:hypothetical protein